MHTLTTVEVNKTIEIILQASEIITSGITSTDNSMSVEQKGFANFVTQIDCDVQDFIEQKIINLFPNHQFLGEEDNEHNFDPSNPCWILDPVDGTKNLILDMHHSCTSLAFWNGEDLKFALIYDPYLDELFEARRGEGAFLISNAKKQFNSTNNFQDVQRKKITINNITDLNHAIVAFGSSPYDRGTEIDHKLMFQVLYEIFEQTEDFRRCGSAALDLAYIAANRHHIFFESKLRPWDFAAGILIIEESGGVVTNFDNQLISLFKASSVLGANPALHKQILPLIKKLRT